MIVNGLIHFSMVLSFNHLLLKQTIQSQSKNFTSYYLFIWYTQQKSENSTISGSPREFDNNQIFFYSKQGLEFLNYSLNYFQFQKSL